MQSFKNHHGLVRAYAWQVANQPYIRTYQSDKAFEGPFAYLQYTEQEYRFTLLDRVFLLLKKTPTYKMLGFTYESLMKLDYATFAELEELVEKLKTDKDKHQADVLDNLLE